MTDEETAAIPKCYDDNLDTQKPVLYSEIETSHLVSDSS